jgi:hypothetical protein
MEKLRNSLSNDAVRGRQSTMYRAQRLAEFVLYDSDPRLVDSELDQFMKVTAADIKQAAARYLDSPNRVVLDIIPAPAAEEEEAVSASPQPPGDPQQPASPTPQIPEVPPAEPQSPLNADVSPIKPAPSEKTTDPAEAPSQTGSGPLHP